jgi:hypothetical protein
LVPLVLFFKAWENMFSLASFTLAYALGIFLLFADEQFLYKFYIEKIDGGQNNDSHSLMLASRNFLFILALPFVSIFVATSSGSIFGIAFILAINFYLLVEMWQLRDEFLLFADRFLAMSKIQVTIKLVHKICWFALAYFIFLLIILLL